MKKLLLLLPLLGCCSSVAAYSAAEQRYDKAIGNVYRNAAMPNQRGVCTYAEDAMRAALEMYSREYIAEVRNFQEKFDCK